MEPAPVMVSTPVEVSAPVIPNQMSQCRCRGWKGKENQHRRRYRSRDHITLTQNNSGQVLETSPFVCRVRVRRRGDPAPFRLARARASRPRGPPLSAFRRDRRSATVMRAPPLAHSQFRQSSPKRRNDEQVRVHCSAAPQSLALLRSQCSHLPLSQTN